MELFIETERLTILHTVEQDLPEILEVYRSNPAYVALTEGPLGMDLERLQRDWQVAAWTGRTMLTIRRRDSNAVIGTADFLDENPNDGHPWLGLLMIQGNCQGEGYGSEALEGLLRHFREVKGWPSGRIGVIRENEKALRFWQRRGFQTCRTVRKRLPAGETEIICMELSLR